MPALLFFDVWCREMLFLPVSMFQVPRNRQTVFQAAETVTEAGSCSQVLSGSCVVPSRYRAFKGSTASSSVAGSVHAVPAVVWLAPCVPVQKRYGWMSYRLQQPVQATGELSFAAAL
jgi:hypothetical protein